MPIINGADDIKNSKLVDLLYDDTFLITEILPFYLYAFRAIFKWNKDNVSLDFRRYLDTPNSQKNEYFIDTIMRFYKNGNDLEAIIENNLFGEKGYKRLVRDVVYYKIENALLYKNEKYKEKIVEKIKALQEKLEPKLLPLEEINEKNLTVLNKENVKLLSYRSLDFIRLEVLYGK